jgi:hypothetical protein
MMLAQYGLDMLGEKLKAFPDRKSKPFRIGFHQHEH